MCFKRKSTEAESGFSLSSQILVVQNQCRQDLLLNELKLSCGFQILVIFHPCCVSWIPGVQKSLDVNASIVFSDTSEKPQDIILENHYLLINITAFISILLYFCCCLNVHSCFHFQTCGFKGRVIKKECTLISAFLKF